MVYPDSKTSFSGFIPTTNPAFRELIQTAIREKAEWETDYRIVHPDGAVRDIHVVGHPVLGTSGHLVEFVGTVIDVTERRRAEERSANRKWKPGADVDLCPQQVIADVDPMANVFMPTVLRS